METTEQFVKGYQWSPNDNKFMGEYFFIRNKDKEEIHMPPFTTLLVPPVSEKGYSPYWDGNNWYIDVDPDAVTEHPPIDDYTMLMPDYIDFLKQNDLWTDEDEQKRLDAIKQKEDEKRLIEESRNYDEELRMLRNSILQQSDWTQLSDTQLTEEQKELWRIYRQELRDLPENVEDPKALVLDLTHPDWPIPPM